MDKRVYLERSGYLGDLEGKMTTIIGYLSGKLHEIPEPYRASAELEFDITHGYEGCIDKNYYIYYSRPETADEQREREAEEAQRKSLQDQRDREQFERLKAKFKDG